MKINKWLAVLKQIANFFKRIAKRKKDRYITLKVRKIEIENQVCYDERQFKNLED